jgi:hypothetical protein
LWRGNPSLKNATVIVIVQEFEGVSKNKNAKFLQKAKFLSEIYKQISYKNKGDICVLADKGYFSIFRDC